MVNFNYYDMPDCSKEVKTPYIFHCGTLQEQKDGILGMIEAFGKAVMKNESIRFICTGYIEQSPNSEEIRALIEKYGIHDKLTFVGYLSLSELRNYLSRAALVIINTSPF